MTQQEQKQLYIDFEAYEHVAEPHKQAKASSWRMAIGLQDVDGLKVSDYLKHTAIKHIKGEITIEEVQSQLRSYYQSKTSHDTDDVNTEEADRVAANIAKILSEQSFSLSALEFLNTHRHLFEGVFKHAGEVRPYDITKKEWVLQGDTVLYGRSTDIREALEYDIQQEREFCYAGLSTDQIVRHIADFTSLLWQNHPFREGNTRTTAVFIIKYLRSCGFSVNNDLFAEHSWYFRNALVRANYRNTAKGIDIDKSFLVLFFRNLLLGESHELKNRYMLVGYDSKHDTPTSTALPASEAVCRIIQCLRKDEMSVKEIMESIGLKDRKNFIDYSLSPAISEGYVQMKYPDAPRHPRQKYLLTLKGLLAYEAINGY